MARNSSFYPIVAMIGLLLSGCRVSRPVGSEVTFVNVTGTSSADWAQPGFQGNAWVIMVEQFHPKRHLEFTANFALANVIPYRADVIFQGVVLSTLAGESRNGQSVEYYEIWLAESYQPYPRSHPVDSISRYRRSPYPAIVITDPQEQVVAVESIARLSQEEQLVAYKCMLDWWEGADDNKIQGYLNNCDGMLFKGPEYDAVKAQNVLAHLLAEGFAFKTTEHEIRPGVWYVGVQPFVASELTQAKAGEGYEEALGIIDRRAAAGLEKFSVSNPVVPMSRPEIEHLIREMISRGEEFRLSHSGWRQCYWISISLLSTDF